MLTYMIVFSGIQQYAKDVGRMFVSGHGSNVGSVGWSVGGGHGQLVPMLGMGVDQVLNSNLTVFLKLIKLVRQL